MSLLNSIVLLSLAGILTGCSGDLIPTSANTPQNALPVHLVTEKQEVKRYDCNGSLTSDQIETVSSPTELMTIQPTKSSWTYATIASSSFVDVETGQTPGYVLNNTEFTIDHSPGYFNMEIADGLNEIDYRFVFTDGSTETGARYIFISWDQTTLTGASSVHPDPSQCVKPTPTP
jgi:hypothetical protein